MSTVPSVAELLEWHVTLRVECLDRLYLNAYIPNLQVPGQVVRFLHDHRGMPLVSPALFRPIGEAFRAAVYRFAHDHAIPVLMFKAADRQVERVRPYFARATRPGVVAIGVAQEYQWVFTASERPQPGSKTKYFAFRKAERRVTCFYFYLWDRHFGPSFIKMCSYFPYPAKVWLNGHEWAKRQLERRGIAYTPLANGFCFCSDPARLQRICDSLSHALVREGPGSGVLVGAVHAPGGDLPHPGARPPPAGPGLLRVGDPGQPRDGPARRGPDDLRSADPPHHQGGVQDPGPHARGGSHDVHLLQALPGQAVPQGGPGHPGGDHHQRSTGRGSPSADLPSGTIAGGRPGGEPTHPGRPTGGQRS